MNLTLTHRTLVTPPTAARLVTDRYKWLSLSLAEPNLGTPPDNPLITSLDFYTLSGDARGNRGWTIVSKPYQYAGGQSQLSIIPVLGGNSMSRFSDDYPFPIGSTIAGGSNNQISLGSSFIGTGDNNTIEGDIFAYIGSQAGYGIIGSGTNNKIVGSIQSTILNGTDNLIRLTENAAILGGELNRIEPGSLFTVLVGGSGNYSQGGAYNFIGPGIQNTVFGGYGTILNGLRNETRASHATILNGRDNNTNDAYSLILNGRDNQIYTSGESFWTVVSSVKLPAFANFANNTDLANSVKLFTHLFANNFYTFVGCPFVGGGRVYVYKIPSPGTTQPVFVTTINNNTPNEYFGYDIDCDSNLNQVIISAPRANNKGAVYIYDFDTLTDTFTFKTTVSTDRVNDGGFFGHSLYFNPYFTIIGAPYHNLSGGAAYVFTRSLTTNNFSDTSMVFLSGLQVGERFGYSVASNVLKYDTLNTDSLFVATAPRFSTPTKANVGMIYLYRMSSLVSGLTVTRLVEGGSTTVTHSITASWLAQSRIGETRQTQFVGDNTKPSSTIRTGAPNWSTPASGAIAYTGINKETGATIGIFGINRDRFIANGYPTGLNLGYSMLHKRNNTSNFYWGAPSIDNTNFSSGQVAYYADNQWKTFSLPNSANYKLFGSSLGGNTGENSVITATSFDRITNEPIINFLFLNFDASEGYSVVLGGSGNKAFGGSSLIGPGYGNEIALGVKNSYIFGSNIKAIQSDTTYVENLSVLKAFNVNNIETDTIIADTIKVTNLSAVSANIHNLYVENLTAKNIYTEDLEALSAVINTLTVKESLCSLGTVVFDTSSYNPALRVTQRGTGAAFLVEDSGNPDFTPFYINQFGQVIFGSLSSFNNFFTDDDAAITISHSSDITSRYRSLKQVAFSNTTNTAQSFYRARGTQSTPTATQNNDRIAGLNFAAFDGERFVTSSVIRGVVDGNVQLSAVPVRLTFHTSTSGQYTDPQAIPERMRIDSQGRVGIGTTSPNELLTVAGTISSRNLITNSLTSVSGFFDILYTKKLSADNFEIDSINVNKAVITSLTALSAIFNVVDITVFELSGFNITGNVTISGDALITNATRTSLLDANNINTTSLSSSTGYITILSAASGTVDSLRSNAINTTILNSGTVNSNTGNFNNLITNSLTALSAVINVIDITIAELSGFNITGNATISGNLFVTDTIRATSAFIANIEGSNIVTTFVRHPSAVSSSRFQRLSLSETEPSLGQPNSTGIYFLTGDQTGIRGWSRGLPELNLENIRAVNLFSQNIFTAYLSAVSAFVGSLTAVSGVFDVIRVNESGSSSIPPSIIYNLSANRIDTSLLLTNNLQASSINVLQNVSISGGLFAPFITIGSNLSGIPSTPASLIYNLSSIFTVIDNLTANNLTIGGGDFGQVIIDNLSAYGNPVYIDQLYTRALTAERSINYFLSAVEGRFDTLCARRMVIGQNSFLTPAAADGSFIIGDNIIAGLSGFLFVRNLSAVGTVISRNINNLAIGLGAGEQESNLAIGVSALNFNSTGQGNIALGRNALARTTTGLFSVSVIDPGFGYEFAPTVFVSGGGFFSWDQPTIAAVLGPVLSGIAVPTISATPTYFLSALTANPNYSSQYQAVTTLIYRIPNFDILNRGTGYYGTPTLIISGGITSLSAILQTTPIPVQAIPLLNTASNNIAIGFNAGATISTGEDNILIGTAAGREVVTGERNTVLGNYNALYPSSSNNIVIGYNNDVGTFNNVILLGNNLSATKSNFAFISTLKVNYLEVDGADLGFLNVSPGGLSAQNLFVTALTAVSAKIDNFDGRVSILQLLRTQAAEDDTILWKTSAWVPSKSITGFPGTRLFDFQLTAYDTGFNIITADTTYCGVAPVIDNQPPSVGASIWRITRNKFNDGGDVFETAVAINAPWSARLTTSVVYTIIPSI